MCLPFTSILLLPVKHEQSFAGNIHTRLHERPKRNNLCMRHAFTTYSYTYYGGPLRNLNLHFDVAIFKYLIIWSCMAGRTINAKLWLKDDNQDNNKWACASGNVFPNDWPSERLYKARLCERSAICISKSIN